MAVEEQIISQLILKGGPEYTAGLKEASGAAETAGTGQQEVAKQSKLSASSMIRAAAATAAVYKGYEFLKGSVDTTLQLAKNTKAFTRVTGLDAKQAQAWILVAQERGLSAKTMSVGMATLGRQLGAVGGPTKSTAAAFTALGLNQAKIIKMPMEKRMETFANAFAKLPNSVNKATLAQRLFGRTGTSMLPIFAGGAKGMNEMLDSASKLVPSNVANNKSTMELVHNQRELNMAMMGVKVALGSALIPILNQAAKAVQPVAVWFSKLLKIFPPLGPMIVAVGAALIGLLVFDKIAGAASTFTDAMKAMKDATILQTAATKAQIAVIKLAEAAQWLWDAAMDANPIVLVVAALVALGVGLVIAYKKVAWFRDLVNAAFNAIKDVVLTVFDFIKAHWKLLALILAGIFLGPIAALVAAFFLFRDKVMAAFDAVKRVAIAVFDWIKSNWKLLAIILLAPFSLPLAAAATALYLLRDKVKIVVKAIVGFFAGLPGKISNAASGMFDGIKHAMSSAVTFVTSKVTAILNLIKKVIHDITSLPSKIASPITSAAKGVAGFAGKGVSLVSGLFGGQHGGVMPHPGGLSLVGEAGPEIVALPGGASVHPLPAPALGGSRRPIVVQTFLEKRQIGQAVADYAGDLQAAR